MVGLASASAALETVKIVMLNVCVQNGRKAHWGFCETRAFWRDGLGNSKLQQIILRSGDMICRTYFSLYFSIMTSDNKIAIMIILDQEN